MYINWDSNQTAEPLASEPTILQGEQVFAQNCATCHGEQGEGHAAVVQAPALNGDEHAWHHPDGQLQEIIINGGVEMPSFQDDLSNEEVAAVIRYFQTLWRADQLKAQQANSAQNPLR
jgi:mono/diheme cytochrome c family protein